MTELNLNDPKVLKVILENSVTDVPPQFQSDEQVAAAAVTEKLQPAETIKAKVAAASKAATYTLKLNGHQLQQVQRYAVEAGFGSDWQSFLTAELNRYVFDGAVATPRITRPSWANTNVSAPTGW